MMIALKSKINKKYIINVIVYCSVYEIIDRDILESNLGYNLEDCITNRSVILLNQLKSKKYKNDKKVFSTIGLQRASVSYTLYERKKNISFLYKKNSDDENRKTVANSHYVNKKQIEKKVAEVNYYQIVITSKKARKIIVSHFKKHGIQVTLKETITKHVKAKFNKNITHERCYYIYDVILPYEISVILHGGDGGASNL